MNPSKLRYHDLLVVLVWEIKTIYDLFKNDQKYERLLQELKKYDIEDRRPLPYQKDLLKTLDITRTQLMNLMYDLYDDFNIKLSKPKAYQISDTQITLCVEISDECYWLNLASRTVHGRKNACTPVSCTASRRIRRLGLS